MKYLKKFIESDYYAKHLDSLLNDLNGLLVELSDSGDIKYSIMSQYLYDDNNTRILSGILINFHAINSLDVRDIFCTDDIHDILNTIEDYLKYKIIPFDYKALDSRGRLNDYESVSDMVGMRAIYVKLLIDLSENY